MPVTKFEMSLTLKKNYEPFFMRPRRLLFAEKNALDDIMVDLLNKGIIRETGSPYC